MAPPDVLPPDAAFHLAEVNGLPGVVVQSQGQTIGVASFDYAGGRIAAIYIVVNPDKLRHVALMQGGHS